VPDMTGHVSLNPFQKQYLKPSPQICGSHALDQEEGDRGQFNHQSTPLFTHLNSAQISVDSNPN
jgi:hypothetical protein